MRNKEVISNKLDRLEAKVKNVGFHIKRNNIPTAYESIQGVLDEIDEIQSLINHEWQDN